MLLSPGRGVLKSVSCFFFCIESVIITKPLGQGRFGKVYTAVNNNTGEMMAVKEIALQHNDSITIKRVSDEMKILEGISHRNLVKYYGVEVYTVSSSN